MLKALSAKKKLCSVDGTLCKLLTTDLSFEQWKQFDDMVSSWIMNVCSFTKNSYRWDLCKYY